MRAAWHGHGQKRAYAAALGYLPAAAKLLEHFPVWYLRALPLYNVCRESKASWTCPVRGPASFELLGGFCLLMENTVAEGEKILDEFAARVRAMGGRYSAVACLDCEDWDQALSRGVATGDPTVVLHLFESLLEAVRKRYGWGRRELEHFMHELNERMNEYMASTAHTGRPAPDLRSL